MKMYTFKNKDKQKHYVIFSVVFVLLCLTALILYRSFALFEESKDFNMISGSVPNQDYDLKFAFVLNNNGEEKIIDKAPEGRDWSVSISCDKEASGVWDYESWGPKIDNLKETRTKCKVEFTKAKSLVDFIVSLPKVNTGEGLYEVRHNDAEITYTDNATAINNLKQTEYRYAGSDPDNYVWFNNELWRVIGLVNTPEGQRVKIIRDESIGEFSWDTSESSINLGYGINEWSQSKIMHLLNDGAYYNRTKGPCYNGLNNAHYSCDFRYRGLLDSSKNMIDTITWNTGSQGNISLNNFKMLTSYNLERSNNTGKICSSGARETCLNSELIYFGRKSCGNNNWLKSENHLFTIMPHAAASNADLVWYIANSGNMNAYYTYTAYDIFPTLYLKIDVKITMGNGSFDLPYILTI